MAEEITDATWVAGLLALCGPELGGAVIASEVAEDFIAALNAAGTAPLRTVSSSMSADALTGTIDLAATLALGRPIQTEGLLTTHPRLLVRRAERLDAACTSLMAAAFDRQALLLLAVMDPHDPESVLAAKLEERLPFRVEGQAARYWSAAMIASARARLGVQAIAPKLLGDLCHAALAIGITSPRAVVQAVTAARGIAALQGAALGEAEVAIAARLVLAHRALYAPAPEQQEEDQPSPQKPDAGSDEQNTSQNPAEAEVILEAVKAALPRGTGTPNPRKTSLA